MRHGVRIVYSPRYRIDIGTHVFPTQKYQLCALERVRASYPGVEFVEPEPASWDELGLVHTPEYLGKIRTGEFDARGARAARGAVVAGSRRRLPADDRRDHTGRASWPPGTAIHCRFATSGVASITRLPTTARDSASSTTWPSPFESCCAKRSIARAAVVDLDVHHGNGTALIFENEPRVFTFSMHQQHNYPAFKPRGSLDVGLPDAHGRWHLSRSACFRRLTRVFAHTPRDGVLPGGCRSLSRRSAWRTLAHQGRPTRARSDGAPCVRSQEYTGSVVLAGGYARKIEDTVDIHDATIDEALT